MRLMNVAEPVAPAERTRCPEVDDVSGFDIAEGTASVPHKKRGPLVKGLKGGWMRGVFVRALVLVRRTRARKGFATYCASFCRTSSFTALPSTACPASFAIAAFMTRPISFADDAPVS